MSENNNSGKVENKNKTNSQSIILVSYPKIIFFYPSAVVALLCAFLMLFAGNDASESANSIQEANSKASTTEKEEQANQGDDKSTAGSISPKEVETNTNTQDSSNDSQPERDQPESARNSIEANPEKADGKSAEAKTNKISAFCGRFFLFVLFVNLVIIGFDFPRTTSLTVFFFVVAVLATLFTLGRMYSWVFPTMLSALFSITPTASFSFYLVYFTGMSILFLAVWISRKFDYWEVRGNELLHHTGILSNMERYPSPNLRIDKEINDVFEYLLLRSGRLILHPSTERKAIILENVVGISRKEDEISIMLRQLEVRVRPIADI